jgi:transportin-1
MQVLANTVPEFPCYLAHILSFKSNQPASVRTMAGYALKAHLLVHLGRVEPNALNYVKQELLASLSDPEEAITRVTGTLISQLFSQIKVERWPEAMLKLVECISDPTHHSFMVRPRCFQIVNFWGSSIGRIVPH